MDAVTCISAPITPSPMLEYILLNVNRLCSSESRWPFQVGRYAVRVHIITAKSINRALKNCVRLGAIKQCGTGSLVAVVWSTVSAIYSAISRRLQLPETTYV